MFSAQKSAAPADGKLYVEDVFSTYLYNGTGAAQTITNGIDLAGKGGLVWTKSRSSSIYRHTLVDTARGGNVYVSSNTTDANISGTWLTFNSDGYGITTTNNYWNASTATYASWTFREAPKFFDVVTYTGNNTVRNISHNLGVAPGCIMVKPTSATGNWIVYHRSLGSAKYIILNSTGAEASSATIWGGSDPTSSVFSVGTGGANNQTGTTYVAYLFAHDATSDGVIQCGSFTTDGSGNATVNLGWEPQWILLKNTQSAANWFIYDTMRGWVNGTGDNRLLPNQSGAEGVTEVGNPTATGFAGTNLDWNNNYIYIAIRRGPMKTPTLGTSVFAPVAVTPVTGTYRTTGFPVDLSIAKTRTLAYVSLTTDRLRGFVKDTSSNPPTLVTSSTNAETTASYSSTSYAFDNTGYKDGPELNGGYPTAYWNFRRSPGFFDEVCYTGTGAARTVNHNLGVAPELIITRARNTTAHWYVHHTFGSTNFKEQYLNNDGRQYSDNYGIVYSAAPAATGYSIVDGVTNGSGTTYVAYLFASALGVSKIGTYTGNGSSQTINCGFAAGARFVMIKRTDSTGDWYVWDTARGIIAANDPHLSLNTTAAEVTTDDSVDTDSTGFVVNQVAATNVNVNGATYIYLSVS